MQASCGTKSAVLQLTLQVFSSSTFRIVKLVLLHFSELIFELANVSLLNLDAICINIYAQSVVKNIGSHYANAILLTF